MTTDLKETLEELGGDYAAMAEGMKKACANVPYVPRRRMGWRVYLKVACWLVSLGLGVMFLAVRRDGPRSTAHMQPHVYTVA